MLDIEKLKELKEEAQLKALEIAKRINKKVHPLFVTTESELVVGFVKEPTLATKMLCINYLAQKQIDMLGDSILMTSLIQEESDPRLIKDGNQDDDIYISACLACVSMVKVYDSEVKKN